MTLGPCLRRDEPGRSKQDYGTPWKLIYAIERRFGKLTIDLAATPDKAKAPNWIGPDRNSLLVDWELAIGDGIGWLNPPFGELRSWAKKCSMSGSASIIMLSPASIGSEWFARYCEGGDARVIGLRPRITFDGANGDPYPKDCMLTLWGEIRKEHKILSTWRWDRIGKYEGQIWKQV